MVLGWLFGKSSGSSRRTTKKLRKGARVNINRKSVSLTVGGKNASVTAGSKGIKPKLKFFGFRIF